MGVRARGSVNGESEFVDASNVRNPSHYGKVSVEQQSEHARKMASGIECY